MAWLLAAAIVAGIFMLIAIIVQAGMIRTAWRMVEFTPPLNAGEADSDARAESVAFQTSDGLTLNGAVFRPSDQSPRGLIVFCHEFGGCRWTATHYTEALIDAGFAVFSFDFRSHGSSDSLNGYEPFHWVTQFEIDDLRSALKFVDSRPGLNELPMGIFGVSRGAGTALSVAAENKAIRAIVCESAYSCRKMMYVFSDRWHSLFGPDWLMSNLPRVHATFTLAAARFIASVRRGCQFVHLEHVLSELRDRPVLLISGKRDNYVGPEIAEHLFEQINSDKAELWLVPRSRHNQAREVSQQEYDERIVALFSQLDGGSAVPRQRKSPNAVRDKSDTVEPRVQDGSLAGR